MQDLGDTTIKTETKIGTKTRFSHSSKNRWYQITENQYLSVYYQKSMSHNMCTIIQPAILCGCSNASLKFLYTLVALGEIITTIMTSENIFFNNLIINHISCQLTKARVLRKTLHFIQLHYTDSGQTGHCFCSLMLSAWRIRSKYQF